MSKALPGMYESCVPGVTPREESWDSTPDQTYVRELLWAADANAARHSVAFPSLPLLSALGWD